MDLSANKDSCIEIRNKNIVEKNIPYEDNYILCAQDPKVDLHELAKKVIYPVMARKAGIEGKVIVRF